MADRGELPKAEVERRALETARRVLRTPKPKHPDQSIKGKLDQDDLAQGSRPIKDRRDHSPKRKKIG